MQHMRRHAPLQPCCQGGVLWGEKTGETSGCKERDGNWGYEWRGSPWASFLYVASHESGKRVTGKHLRGKGAWCIGSSAENLPIRGAEIEKLGEPGGGKPLVVASIFDPGYAWSKSWISLTAWSSG